MQNANIYAEVNRTTIKLTLISTVLRDHEQLFKWRPKERIMDLGCGPGDVTANVLLPWLPPDFHSLLGVDISASLITHAMAHHASNKVTFTTADFDSDVSHIIQDNSGFDKIFSFYVLHWLQDLRKGVKNIYCLLRPGGQALLSFPVDRNFQKTFSRVAAKQEWRKYFKSVTKRIPPYLTGGNPRTEFHDMLSSAGFEILKCETYDQYYDYPSAETFKNMIESVDPDIDCIPFEQKARYLDDCLKEMIDLGCVKVEEPVTRKQKMMISVIRKPDL